MKPIAVTHHALDRYRIHQTDATELDVAAAITSGREESIEVIQAVCGRIKRPPRKFYASRYIVTEDNWGAFVIVDDAERSVVITYLRFIESQRWFFTGERPVRVDQKNEDQLYDHPKPLVTAKEQRRRAEQVQRREQQRLLDLERRYKTRRN